MTPNEINKKIAVELLSSLESYNMTIDYMLTDTPIGVLCLKKSIEKVLLNEGCSRVRDVLDLDLRKIEGLTDGDILTINAALNQLIPL